MTDTTTTRTARPDVPDDPAAIHADIEDAREKLSGTVDEIRYRLDVKSRAKDVAHDAGSRMRRAGHRATEIGRRRSVRWAGGGVAIAAAAGASVLVWRRWER
jgi:Protein of unknown function (DUF3618)